MMHINVPLKRHGVHDKTGEPLQVAAETAVFVIRGSLSKSWQQLPSCCHWPSDVEASESKVPPTATSLKTSQAGESSAEVLKSFRVQFAKTGASRIWRWWGHWRWGTRGLLLLNQSATFIWFMLLSPAPEPKLCRSWKLCHLPSWANRYNFCPTHFAFHVTGGESSTLASELTSALDMVSLCFLHHFDQLNPNSRG